MIQTDNSSPDPNTGSGRLGTGLEVGKDLWIMVMIRSGGAKTGNPKSWYVDIIHDQAIKFWNTSSSYLLWYGADKVVDQTEVPQLRHFCYNEWELF